MMLTDDDLKKLFPFGMAVVEEDSEDATPTRGLPRPHVGNPEWFDLWITDGANTVFPREVEPASDVEDGGVGYMCDRLGTMYRLVPVPESQKVVF